MTHGDRIGVGIVGLGVVGEAYCRTVAEHRACHLRWVHDVDRARATSIASWYEGVRVADGLDRILGDDGIKIVAIATYDQAHFEQVMAALGAGKHVFVEKPICQTQRQLQQIKERWSEASELRLGSNLILRAAPLYQWLKATIEAGELGQIYALDGDYLYGRLRKITEGWRGRVPGYSVMQGGGIHLIDLLLWLTGERFTEVYAVGNRICTQGSPFEANDFVSATFVGQSGIIGRITANFGCVHRHHHVLRVFGTKGTFLFDDSGARHHLVCDPARGACAVHASPLPPSKGELFKEFLSACAEQRTIGHLPQSIFDCMALAIASDHSVQSGHPVTIQYP